MRIDVDFLMVSYKCRFIPEFCPTQIMYQPGIRSEYSFDAGAGRQLQPILVDVELLRRNPASIANRHAAK